jgi:peptidoglycan/xylan/chitin deacetylase (PgdA/CDA1 family)
LIFAIGHSSKERVMMNDSVCLCVRAADEFAPCVDYVVRSFGRWAGAPSQTMAPEEMGSAAVKSAARLVFLYGRDDELPEWRRLAEQQLRPAAIIAITRSGFFGPGFLGMPDLPEPADKLTEMTDAAGFDKYRVRDGEHFAHVRADLVAAAFWFLSRYEEYVTSPPETHNRFLASFSIAPPEMYDRPVVNRWFERIAELIEELAGPGEKQFTPPKARIVLTHDVDLMRKYRGMMGVRRTISAMIRGDAREATSEIRTASLVLAGLRRDPYDSFDAMFSLEERIGAPSTFFLMGGGDAPLDGDYTLDDQPMRELLARIEAAGDEIGLHGSYESWRSPEQLLSEMQALERAVGHSVIGARQHYLRFALPETWYAQGQCGLRYDTTLSFPDRTGFRCGWSGCMRPFDIEKRIELPIVELPLVAMDVSLAVYEKIPAEHAIERLARLLDASQTRDGAFVLLWHNTLHDRRAYPGYWDTMEYFLFASAGTAEFCTAAQMCENFELRMVTTG